MYQGTVPLSTGVRLFGVLSFTSVGNRFMFGTAGTIPRGSDAKETFFEKHVNIFFKRIFFVAE